MKDAYKVFTVGLEGEIEAASFQDAAQKMLEKHSFTSVRSVAVQYVPDGTVEFLDCQMVHGKLGYGSYGVIDVVDETEETRERLAFLASGEAIEDQ